MFQGEQSDIEWVDERWPKIDFVRTFPPELVEVIFSNLNPESVYSCLQASRMWNSFIEMDDSIWKTLCKNFDKASITDDLKCGLTWKEIFIKNYGIQGLIRRWIEGKYSNIRCYEEMAEQNLMATFSVEAWGAILDAELSRKNTF